MRRLQKVKSKFVMYNRDGCMSMPMSAILCCILLLQGCAAVALTAGGIAAGVGVNYTMSGIAYKTLIAPIPETRLATLKTLNVMEVNVTQDEVTEEGWQITGYAADREIDIELEKLTSTTTRMRVTVNKGHTFLKDRATATEIVAQSVLRLEKDRLTAEADGWGN